MLPQTYWITSFITRPLTPGGQWFWLRTTATSNGYEHYFHNPSGGFGYGTNPVPRQVVFQTPADLSFRIIGDLIPEPATLVGLSAGLAVLWLRRLSRKKDPPSRECLLVLATLAIFSPAGYALAYDTEHHANLTRSTLLNEGFGRDAIDTVMIANWLTDYFSNSPTANLEADLKKLHFDNLFTTLDVANYWGRLAEATFNACQRASRTNDPFLLLIIMGITLHAVQDFYTHFNWLDYYPICPRGGFQAITWFDDPNRMQKTVYTGAYPTQGVPPQAIELHGDYFDGLNKDSYSRRSGWLGSYIMAYKASVQWVRAMQIWTNNPNLWTAAQNIAYNPGDRRALDFDLFAAYGLSAWIYLPRLERHQYVHGKWKGYKSGDAALFAGALASWGPSTSRFQNAFKVARHHLLISNALFASSPVPPPTDAPIPLPRVRLDQQAVVLRTLAVDEQQSTHWIDDPPADRLHAPDYQAFIWLGNRLFIEATQMNTQFPRPDRTAVEFFPRDRQDIDVEYWLYDEDATEYERVDIHPTRNRYHLALSFNTRTQRVTGDINGLFNTHARAIRIGGALPDMPRAYVKFLFTVYLLMRLDAWEARP